MKNQLVSIPDAIQELKKGNMLIIIDSPNRENQGDLIFPAETVTSVKVNFLLDKCHGIVCVALTSEQAVRLNLPLMVPLIDNTEKTRVQFTVTVDTTNTTSFGISAFDRAKTIKILADPQTGPNNLVRPGHIFPLLARKGGVLERAGHTEATVELCRLAGFQSCGVLCEILTEKGEVAGSSKLIEFSKKYNIKLISIIDLVEYVKNNSLNKINDTKEVIKTATSTLPTKYGKFRLIVYKSVIDNKEHVVLIKGGIQESSLLRIHSQCITGDTFLSLKCDCGKQLHQSMNLINKNSSGVILYLNQEGRGIGLTNKIRAYALQDKGLDTVEANESLGFPIDARQYKVSADILKDLGIFKINLLTNNPDKEKQLSKFGIEIVKIIPLETKPNNVNRNYLEVKKKKLCHLLNHI